MTSKIKVSNKSGKDLEIVYEPMGETFVIEDGGHLILESLKYDLGDLIWVTPRQTHLVVEVMGEESDFLSSININLLKGRLVRPH